MGFHWCNKFNNPFFSSNKLKMCFCSMHLAHQFFFNESYSPFYIVFLVITNEDLNYV